jgi:tetratricopeptide repeat protein
MATSEIEKLERRYAENPHGLTFAPLAEVHRKNGDVARALELLTAGLELHPNYIPASIVLGRCHQDLGDLPAAEAAFAHVLRLDDENVIALKSLADINERLERFDDAESWLRRLVSVDRSNDEALEQLGRLETARNGRPASAVGPVVESAGSGSDPVEASPERPKRPSAEVVAIDIAALDLVESTAAPVEVGEAPPPPSEPVPAPPMVLERTPQFSDEKPPEKITSITETPEPSGVEPVQAVAGLISQEFEAPKEPIGPPLKPLDIDLETSQEVVLEGSGMSEYRVPDASEDLREVANSRAAGGLEFRVPEVSEDLRETVEVPDKAPGQPTFVAPEGHGQSVAAFFRAMLAARPPAEASASPLPSQGEEGTPTHPVQDGLSLSSVFGQEAVPAPGATVGSEPKTDEGVSFDDFFGSKTEGTSAEKNAEPGKDDLDQFHSWLQNLKR